MCGFILLETFFVVWAFSLNSIYSNPFFHILEFLMGMVLVSLMPELRNNRHIPKSLFSASAVLCEIILGIVAISAGVSFQIAAGNYMLFSWIVLPLFCLMLPALVSQEFRTIRKVSLLTKMISYLSEISYAFFLMQLFIWPIMRRLCKALNIEGNMTKIFLSIAVCTILATLVHELIEKPSKNFLSRKLLRT